MIALDINHEYTPDITCPWCGNVERDSWERQSNDGQDDCGECGKHFEWSRNVTVDYSTARKESV